MAKESVLQPYRLCKQSDWQSCESLRDGTNYKCPCPYLSVEPGILFLEVARHLRGTMAHLSMHFSIERVPLPLPTHNTSWLVQMMAILERAAANESKGINSTFCSCIHICCDQFQRELEACALQIQIYSVESLCGPLLSVIRHQSKAKSVYVDPIAFPYTSEGTALKANTSA